MFLEATYNGNEKNDDVQFSYGLFITLVSLSLNLSNPPVAIFFNAVVIDPFSTLMKMVMVLWFYEQCISVKIQIYVC